MTLGVKSHGVRANRPALLALCALLTVLFGTAWLRHETGDRKKGLSWSRNFSSFIQTLHLTSMTFYKVQGDLQHKTLG